MIIFNKTVNFFSKSNRLLLFMKMYLALTLVFILQATASVYSQNTKISLNYENAQLGEVLSQIEKNTEFVFFYRHGAIDQNIKVDIQAKDMNIHDVLSIMFRGTGIEWTVKDRLIILGQKETNDVAVFQGITISGIVTDIGTGPLPGVNVILKGTMQGTVTDANGAYTLQVPDENATLVFSFLGFAPQEVLVGTQRYINISLREDTQEIEEVVVIGYGTVRKSDLAGSVASVSSKKFKDEPVTRIQDILQGRTAGMEVTSQSGMVDGAVRVRIRGTTSINKNSEPLYVVDGIVSSGLNGLNPSDIQSIEVLKDASATAIYGSRGAKGVVLVTTKRGEAGRSQISLEANIGISKIIKKYDLLSPYEFGLAANDIIGAGTFSATDLDALKNGTKGHDYQDLLLQNGFRQDYKLSVSGGSQKTQYFVSANIMDMTPITITTKYKRYQFRANLDTEVTPWFNIGTNLNLGHRQLHNNSINIEYMLSFSPAQDFFIADGVTYDSDRYNCEDSSNVNPYGYRTLDYNDNLSYQADGNVNLRFKIIDGLTLSVQGGLYYLHAPSYSFTSRYRRPTQNNSNMANSTTYNVYLQNTNNLTYFKRFGDHQITATAVWEISQTETKEMGITGTNLGNDMVGYWDVNNAATRAASNAYSAEAMASGVFRAMYSYKSRYFLTGTFRADGSSKFLGDNKWGYFPSGAVAWDIAKEDFFGNQKILQQLKVRTSYGVTGNQDIDRYSTQGLISRASQATYGTATQYFGYWGSTFATPNVSWEKTYQYDAGVDVSVLNSRVNLSFDFFLKQTKDLLFQKAVPTYNGGGTFWHNLGEVKNSGIDFTIDAFPVRGNDLVWESALVGSFVKNEVVDMGGETFVAEWSNATFGGDIQVMTLGRPVGSFYVYRGLGFDDAGCRIYERQDGSRTITPTAEDRFVMGQSNPKWTFGWNNTVSWKNWTFNLFCNAATGFNRLNFMHFSTSQVVANFRMVTLRDGYYKGWNHVTNKADAKYPSHTNGNNKNFANTDIWLENASYLKLKNVSIAYNIPRSVLQYIDAQLSFSVQNLYTFTNYKGMDPEVYDTGSGVDKGAYPIPRTFSFGLKVNF